MAKLSNKALAGFPEKQKNTTLVGVSIMLSMCLFAGLPSQSRAGDRAVELPPGLHDSECAGHGPDGFACDEGADGTEDLLSLEGALLDDDLAGLEGGAAHVVDLVDLDGTVTGNSVGDSVVTGDLFIYDGAFESSNGATTVMLNTGNNVSMQSSTIVNVIFMDESGVAEAAILPGD